jgi:hypothetical protein
MPAISTHAACMQTRPRIILPTPRFPPKRRGIVPLPRPDALQPYQASVDSNHNVWTNIMNRDEVMKFDVRTSQWTEYAVPTLGAEMRYFSILEHNGSMQLIMPYSRTKKLRG